MENQIACSPDASRSYTCFVKGHIALPSLKSTCSYVLSLQLPSPLHSNVTMLSKTDKDSLLPLSLPHNGTGLNGTMWGLHINYGEYDVHLPLHH